MSSETTRKQRQFDLRNAADQIAAPVARYMGRFDRLQLQGAYDAIAVYDSIDYVISIDTQVRELKPPTGSFFDTLNDIDIEVSFTHDVTADLRGDVDSVFYHSDIPYADGGDMGVIAVSVVIPSDPTAKKVFFRGLGVELRAALAHEMQHAVQYVVLGKNLQEMLALDLQEHAVHPDEIDARVEEVIAYMSDDTPESDRETFEAKLIGYIERYLTRNAVSLTQEQLNVYRHRMLDDHMKLYDEKMGVLLKDVTVHSNEVTEASDHGEHMPDGVIVGLVVPPVEEDTQCVGYTSRQDPLPCKPGKSLNEVWDHDDATPPQDDITTRG